MLLTPMNESYFLYFGGEKHGPYPMDRVRSMWTAGEIMANAVYRRDGEDEWKPLSDAMAGATPAAAAPSPATAEKPKAEKVVPARVAPEKPAPEKAVPNKVVPEKATQSTATPEKAAPGKVAADKPATRTFVKPATGPGAQHEPIFFKRPKPSATQLAKHEAWRRLFARVVDNVIVEILFFAVLMLFARGPLINLYSHGWMLASLALWLPVVTLLMLWDSYFLPKYGATPGKWMFGITVTKEGGGKLSRSEAGSRFFGLLFYVFIPFLQFITLYLVFSRFKTEGITPWDKSGGYAVKPGGDIRWLPVAGVAALWFLLVPWFMGKISHPPAAQNQPVSRPSPTAEPVATVSRPSPTALPSAPKPSPTAKPTTPAVSKPSPTPSATATAPARTPAISLPSATVSASASVAPRTPAATPHATPAVTAPATPVAKPAMPADFSETVKVVEEDAGFAYELPRDWFVQQVPGWKTRAAFGAIKDGTPCNITYQILGSRRTLDEEEASLLNKIGPRSEADGFTQVEVIATPGKFEAASGEKAARFVMTSVRQDAKAVRQVSYLFERRDGKKVEMICNAVERGDSYDAAFDAIMKTFRVTK